MKFFLLISITIFSISIIASEKSSILSCKKGYLFEDWTSSDLGLTLSKFEETYHIELYGQSAEIPTGQMPEDFVTELTTQKAQDAWNMFTQDRPEFIKILKEHNISVFDNVTNIRGATQVFLETFFFVFYDETSKTKVTLGLMPEGPLVCVE